MNLDTITLDRDQAQQQLEQYRDALDTHDDPEYHMIARGLRWLRRENVEGLIDLRAAIGAGGVDRLHRPNLAVCQADAEWCWMERTTRGSVTFSNRELTWAAHNARRGIVRLPDNTLPIVTDEDRSAWRHRRAKAMVPLVPPRLRPRPHLRNYHIIWEAEWRPEPPVDPALLKHIGGDLYAVLGTWDLTPLERAVLAHRLH